LGDDAATESWGTTIAALPLVGQARPGTVGVVVVVVVGSVVVVVPGSVVVVVVVVVVEVVVVDVELVGEVAVAGVELRSSPPTRTPPSPVIRPTLQSFNTRVAFTHAIYNPALLPPSR
jgi:hypothetical protein